MFTYEDTTIYQSDLDLCANPRWLNDRVIAFYFDYLNSQLQESKLKLKFINPSVVMMINILPTETLKEEFASLDLPAADLIFIPINDKTDLEAEIGGSHWSLLVWIKKDEKFYTFDSYSGANNQIARRTAYRFSQLVSNKSVPTVQTGRAPCQTNGYDCGVYTIVFAEWIATHYPVDLDQISSRITPLLVSQKRTQLVEIMKKLTQKS
uniref:Ubiquitin-like protease family profile domain-containing protein n=1 Tax=Arcella intermedia TaxID=1963864 RepID=A0A6B2LHV5_9EUKA